jgi:hypothetical protein
MLNEDDLSANSGPTRVVAERDTVESKKYVADREARLLRTWLQNAASDRFADLWARGR